MTLSRRDYRDLYMWAVNYTTRQQVNSIIQAAEYYYLADESEKVSVKLGFEEGVRNHAKSQTRVNTIMKDFDDWVEYWKVRYADVS